MRKKAGGKSILPAVCFRSNYNLPDVKNGKTFVAHLRKNQTKTEVAVA